MRGDEEGGKGGEKERQKLTITTDFVKDDLPKYYPNLARQVNITLVQGAEHILNTYDHKISQYIFNFLLSFCFPLLPSPSPFLIVKFYL